MTMPQNQIIGQARDAHLVCLRDALDLPFNTMKDGALIFLLSDRYPVVACRTADAYLSIACDIASASALSAPEWHMLATCISEVYSHDFPVGEIVVGKRLGLLCQCSAGIDVDAWLRCSCRALTLAMTLQDRLHSKAL